MKNLLTIIILLCFINAGAQQSIVYTPMTAAGYQYKYVKTDSGFNLPNIDTTTGRGTVRGGSMVFNPANRTFYGWDGIRWNVLGSGSSSTAGTFVDSITVSGNNVCQWIAGVPTCYTVIANSVFYGVDSLTYSGNSICWWKAGIPSCYSIVGSGVDSVTVINGLFCEWKNGVATCDSIFNNVLNVFIDSITIVNNQLCQYVGGVPTCYTINNTSTGVDSITVVDSILCSWSQGVSTCFNLNRTDTIYVKDDLTVDTTTNPGHQTIGRLHDDGLITPGYVTWSGTGLTFDVTSADYYLNRTHYISPQSQITLDPADPTDPRLDVVGVDTTTAVIKITGTAAAVPITPQIDPSSEIALTTILLNAGDTIPTGIGLKVIYNENTEWTTAHTGTMTVNFNNTDNPYIGTKSAFVSSYNNRSALTFTDSGLDTVNLMNVLKMFIWLNCPLTNQFQFQFFLNTTAVSNRISFGNSFGLNSAVVNSWQNVSIPYSAFTWTGQTFNKLVITMAGTDNSCGYYIDYIQIQSGLNFPGKSYVDSVSVIAGSDYYWKNGIKTLIGVRTSGTGTLTSISQGNGIIATPNPITTVGSIKADTSTAITGLTTLYLNGRNYDSISNITGGIVFHHVNGTLDTLSTAQIDTTSLSDRINLKQNLITLTTTGTSGASTFNQGTGALNIPNYATGSGTVTTVTGTAPIVITSTPTTTPNVTITAMNATTNGYVVAGGSASKILHGDGTWKDTTAVSAGGGGIADSTYFWKRTGNVAPSPNNRLGMIGLDTMKIIMRDSTRMFLDSAGNIVINRTPLVGTTLSGKVTILSDTLKAALTLRSHNPWQGTGPGPSAVPLFEIEEASGGTPHFIINKDGDYIKMTGGGQTPVNNIQGIYLNPVSGDAVGVFAEGTAGTEGGFMTNGSIVYMGAFSNHSVIFRSANANKGIFTSAGLWGLGTGATPTSNLTVQGSFATAYVAKSAAFTATVAEGTINCDGTSAAFNITLPTAVGITGRIYVIRKSDASANAITVATTSSQTINGATTYALATQYKYVQVQSDGANWMIIANN